MQVLLDFVRRYFYVLLFIILEVVSLVTLIRFNRYQGNVWFTGANAVVAQVNGLYDEAVSYFELRNVNQQLAADNVRLQLETDSLRQALADARHEVSCTESRVLERLEGYKLIPATVVSNSTRRANNYIVLDRGEADGVKPEMGVVGGGGIIGIVYLVAPHYSLVIPVTNVKSNISCRVRGQNYFGYLQWDGVSTRRAFVDDIPRYAKVKSGNVVETSGYSSVFPPGIFVGRVKTVSNSPDGQSYRLEVNLGTDFSNLRNVNIVATPYRAEIDTLATRALMQEAQDE